LNSLPDHIQRFKPPVGRRFISHLSPDPLLCIESRLVRRKIGEANTCVSLQETSNLFPFMPTGPIYIQPDLIALKSTIDLAEASEESFSVPLRTPQQSHSSQQRCNPPEDIQSLVVLTGSQNPEATADFGPSSTKTRMQGKSCFIFEDDGLLSFQGSEFFLTCGGTSSHPRYAPADRYIPLASSGTPTDASTTEPDVPSDVFQTDFLNAPPRSDHPTEPYSNQKPQAIFPDALPTLGEPAKSTERVAQVALRALGILDLVHSPCASIDLSSDESYQALRLSIPDADPPMSATEPRSLFQQRLPGFPELLSTNCLGLLRDAPTPNLVFA
jgi:hypothetical protein